MKEFADRIHGARVDEAGMPLQIHRSLADPEFTVPKGTRRLVTGCTANWFDFTDDYLTGLPGDERDGVAIEMILGTRIMDQPTELKNKNVIAFQAEHDGELPTETQYGEKFSKPRLEGAGFTVEEHEFTSSNADELLSLFVVKKPEFFSPDQHISAVKTSISALQLILQMRKAARENGMQTLPTLYFEANGRTVAGDKAGIDTPLEFQAPQPGLRQGALNAKLLLTEQLADAV